MQVFRCPILISYLIPTEIKVPLNRYVPNWNQKLGTYMPLRIWAVLLCAWVPPLYQEDKSWQKTANLTWLRLIWYRLLLPFSSFLSLHYCPWCGSAKESQSSTRVRHCSNTEADVQAIQTKQNPLLHICTMPSVTEGMPWSQRSCG